MDDSKTMIMHVRSAVDEYLRETSFGILSLWRHGESGKQRAEKMKTMVNLDVVWNNPKLIWSILHGLYQMPESSMRSIITKYITYSGIFGLRLYYDMKKNMQSEMGEDTAREVALRNIFQSKMIDDNTWYNVMEYLNEDIDDYDFLMFKVSSKE